MTGDQDRDAQGFQLPIASQHGSSTTVPHHPSHSCDLMYFLREYSRAQTTLSSTGQHYALHFH
jgi:hypothetical protein